MRDLRNALRSIIGTPVVSAVAVLSLALGIGANTAIFSIIDSLLLRSLPVRAPERLALLVDGDDNDTWTHPIWEQIERHTELFDGLLAWSTERFNLSERGETDYVEGIFTSGSFFEVLGVPAILGRTLEEADNQRGGGPDGPVAVISYAFWQSRFGGAADVLGQTLPLSGVSYTVVGVTGPEFFGPEVGSSFDVAVPIGTEPLVHGARDSWTDNRSAWWLQIMVRVKPDQPLESATTAIRGVQPMIREATIPERWRPQDIDQYLSRPLTLQPAATGTSSLRNRYRQPLTAILAVVGLVLLIACANIANLQLARASGRRHELSVRLALGASRVRLARLLMTESLLLSLIGAGFGLALAVWGSRFLVGQLSTRTQSVFLDLTLDWRALTFTAVVAVATALLFGLIPALRSSRVEPIEALKERGRGVESGRLGIHNVLVVAQVALSLVLVLAAGLFVQTFSKLAHLDLGFQQDRVLVVNCNLKRESSPGFDQIALYRRLSETVSSLPGVASAAASIITPMGGFRFNTRIKVTDGVELSDRERVAHVNIVSPGWFATYGTTIVAGRDFNDRDRVGSPPVALVNKAFARHFLGDGNPVGRVFQRDGSRDENPPHIEVVGLVEDAVYGSLRDPVPPTVYLSLWQSTDPPPFSSLSVRAADSHPAMLTRSIAEAIAGIDKNLSITFRPLAEQVDSALIQERLVAWLSAFFGGLALLLAGLGLYGVTSYSVSRRRFEIGVRMALGANPALVVRMVLRNVALLVGLGVVVGALIGIWGSGFVESLLYGLQPNDPDTYALAAALLALVGVLSAWVPAFRASRVDPLEALRGDG